MRATPRFALAAIAAAGLLLAACGGDDDSSDTTDTTAAAGADASTTTAAATGPTYTVPGDGTGNECTTGKTLDDGTLTIGTGNPAFPPYVIDDQPESGQGFESAVAYAVAEGLGFSPEHVTWVRTGFDEAIQPGEKNFDFNLQQISISPEREETVSFSHPYYTSNQAVVALDGSPAIGATSVADLKSVKFGVQSGTTSLQFITDVIQPDSEPYVYDTNEDAKAALAADQIDAIVADVPTALFISAVEIEGSSVVGQFPDVEGQPVDEFGLVLDKDSPLVDCVNEVLDALDADGTLDALAEEWLSDPSQIPVIAVG
jgi:polar amino acid transport system substrate-binding protein